jgi:uncharacterized protein YndB with AHSA1/START domain
LTPPSERELVITRIFDAPRELVFKAWTDQEQVARWWSPKHFTNPFCEVDARPGGAILIHMRAPDGAEFPMNGRFLEIVEPERLVFTSSALEEEEGNPLLEVLTTVTFADQGGKTKLTMHALVTKAAPGSEGALAGMEEGWNQSLDKLEEFLDKGQGGTNMAKTQVFAEPGKHDIMVTRDFDAPRDLVFKVYTDPELMPEWLGPRRLAMTIHKMEVRPGGSWRYTHREADGTEYGFRGVYHDVVSPERIVGTFEFEGMPGHVSLESATFEDHDGKTRLTIKSVFQSVEDRDGMLQSGMEGGMSEAFERLDELLAKA